MKTSRLSRHWNEAGLAPAFSLPLSAACFLVDTPATGDRKRKREEKKGRKRGHSTFLVFFSSSGLRQRDPLPRRGPEKVECPFFFFLHTDHLNTPRLATDKTQTVLWRWEGEAFGGTAPNEDADGDQLRITLNLRFPGQYADGESGLYYNWNRYYDPWLGRYITSDPIGVKGGLNTYAYVDSNPLRWIDPTGLEKICRYVIGGYYDKLVRELIKPEIIDWESICIPVPKPRPSFPDPIPRRRPGFPIDPNIKMDCSRGRWVVTQEAEYGTTTEKWMWGWMECKDTCTGEVSKHWMRDRPANDFPNF